MDSDGDGVPDRMDRCPNTPAASNEVGLNGCHFNFRVHYNAYIHPCEVHFASGQATLSTHAKVCLESKVETIQEYGLISAEIVAHTDNVGTSAMNRKLSWRRGKAVADFLIKSGVPAQKIFITAVGEKNPMAPNDTRYGRAENRRVEISLEVERTEPSKYRSKNEVAAWTGRYAEFRTLLDKGEVNAAGDLAKKWRQEDLADVLALIALGEWYEKTGNLSQAARAYGSLIDYFPERADIRRWAAERLLAIRAEPWLSIDSLKTALQQRSDHPSGHYLLAIAYWEAEQYQQAVATLQAAQQVDFDSRFSESRRILQETQALMLTQLAQHQQLETWFPGKSIQWQEVTQPQLRFVLMWETDANDVDFHIYDGQRNHAFYQQRTLSTGGDLYADITRGYGPECFRIVEPKTYPYQLQLHYFSRGPMGYGMGILHVLHYDLTAGLKSQFRPFLIMQDAAFVNLGEVTP
jgi:tetratricopeptide (TPR) repeat protein